MTNKGKLSVKIESKSKKGHFWHVFVIIEWSRFFLGNPALSRHPTHCPLSSCQKSKKTIDGKYHNFLWPTNQPTNILALCSTEVENCNVLVGRVSTSVYSSCSTTCSYFSTMFKLIMLLILFEFVQTYQVAHTLWPCLNLSSCSYFDLVQSYQVAHTFWPCSNLSSCSYFLTLC